MKKSFLVSITLLLLLPLHVFAAGKASISGASSVEVGSSVTVTVTLTNTASWNIKINSSGSTSGCSQSFADASSNGKNTTKKLSVTCKATSIGTIGFTVSGDITSADGANSNVSLSKRVTVTPVREKSKDANLASITLEGYTLSPEFNKETLEYETTIPSTVNTVILSAKANESHASVAGVGEFEVTEGINTFEIVVTAENGNQKTYKVHVNVEDTNPIHVKIGNDEYTVIKNAKSLTKPETYEEKTVTINDFTIPAFYSDITKFTLVGLKSQEGKIYLAIYEEETNTYVLYNEITAGSLNLYLVDFPKEFPEYTKSTLEINNVVVPIYKFSNSRFVLVYGMNIETGEYDYYTYDTKEATFQSWNHEEIDALNKEVKTYQLICFAFGIGLFFAFILILCLLKKRKKKNKKKDQKEEKKKEVKEQTQEEKLKQFDQFEEKKKK